VTRIESAKHITGEEWDLNFLDPIGPFAANLAGGKKNVISLSS
jgi:hypothetical protein